MGLDITLTAVRETEVYNCNITHNLTRMANAAGIYQALWRPEELGIERAEELVPLLAEGLAWLKSNEQYFRQFDAPNGWGTYEHFVPFVEQVLEACQANPDAKIHISS
jgi:hypothetical protein